MVQSVIEGYRVLQFTTETLRAQREGFTSLCAISVFSVSAVVDCDTHDSQLKLNHYFLTKLFS